jgi:hypothetical protein
MLSMGSTTNPGPLNGYSSFKCKICGMKFDSLGDMQRHTTIEHIQKGELQ